MCGSDRCTYILFPVSSCISLVVFQNLLSVLEGLRRGEREAMGGCCLGRALRESAALLLVGIQVTKPLGGISTLPS